MPAGDYHLRRDLGAVTRKVTIAAGEVSELEFGALRFTGPEAAADIQIFVAERETGAIAATTYGSDTALAMAEGTYLVASTPTVAPATVEVGSGAVSHVPLTLVDWADRAAEPKPVVLMTGALAMSLPEGGAGRYVLFGDAPLSIRPDEDSARELTVRPGGHVLLWRLSDGRYPALDGLPLQLQDGVPGKAARGLALPLVTELGDRASVDLTLVQGERKIDLGRQSLGAGRQQFAVTVPDDLDEARPVRIEIGTQGDMPMTGSTPELDVSCQVERCSGRTDGRRDKSDCRGTELATR